MCLCYFLVIYRDDSGFSLFVVDRLASASVFFNQMRPIIDQFIDK